MYLQALHCPCCGAPLEVPEGASRVSCGYCQASLVVDHRQVTGHRAGGARPSEPERPFARYEEPDATLSSRQSPRFEASIIEQRVPGAPDEVFQLIELTEERFAMVRSRAVDGDGKPVPVGLEPGLLALRRSLEEDSDPGLAANQMLEALGRAGFEARLEVTIALFEPRSMRVVPYSAGAAEALIWASTEEARCVSVGGHRQALERKHLRADGDHFDNGRPIQLAAQDLVLLPSAALVDRSGNGAHVLYETVNAHLGDEPLRLVTLAKNAFWADFQARQRSAEGPRGPVRLAAVRAIPPPLVDALPRTEETLRFATRRFEVALRARPGDVVRLVPLHAERQVLIWFSGDEALAPERAEAGIAAITAVLDRRDHGDNENPRRAGREALVALQAREGSLRVCVIQLFDAYGRVKYFRAGFKQPIALGPRGRRADSLQAFDEGGEATVTGGARLFFAGQLGYEDQPTALEGLSRVWNGGKTSRLHEACVDHWKVKKTAAALEGLARAAISDRSGAQTHGLALVTGTGDGS